MRVSKMEQKRESANLDLIWKHIYNATKELIRIHYVAIFYQF